MMTTEGAIGYRDLMEMDDAERLGWLQKCIDHTESLEEKDPNRKKKTVDRF